MSKKSKNFHQKQQINQKADANAAKNSRQARQPSFLILDSVKGFASAKQQRNAPNACKSYNSVDDAGEERGLSTADPGNEVKLKQSDAAPVESAYDGQNQRNAIQNHHDGLLFLLRNSADTFCVAVLKFRLFVVCANVVLLCAKQKKKFCAKNNTFVDKCLQLRYN